MAAVLESAMRPLQTGPKQAPWAYFHGLHVLAIDGFMMNVPKTAVNVIVFGMPSNGSGTAAFPQIRVVACRDRESAPTEGRDGVAEAGQMVVCTLL
ncbi:hypothetical protein [Streptosporangium amethystogenes]|uniref:hypothetical protein n=1 Tax=Streptosporangium amethystogenes TaxID=2002 RepID=UPI0004CB9282|nr:hypothetical protein [Streptosporangium amethystogenes]